MECRLIVAVGVEDSVIHQRNRHFGVLCPDLVQNLIDGFGDADFAGPLGAEDRKGDNLFAVHPRKRPQFLIGIDDLAKVPQPHVAPRRQGDGGLGKAFGRRGIAQGPDRLLAAADPGAACAKIGIGGAQLGVHRRSGDAEAVQFHRVQFDPDFAVGPAVAVHPAHAGAALQGTGDLVIHEPRQLFQRHVGRRDAKGHDRLTFDIDPCHDRRFDIAGQIALDLVNRVLDVLYGLVGGHFHAEFDGCRRHAIGHGGNDVLHTGDAGNGIFDFLGDLGFHLGRGGTRLGDGHGNQRHVDVRKAGDGQRVERLPTQNHQHEERQDRRNRILYRPGREIHRRTLSSCRQRRARDLSCPRRAQRLRLSSQSGRRPRHRSRSRQRRRRGCPA